MKRFSFRIVEGAGLSVMLAVLFALPVQAKFGQVSNWLGKMYSGDGLDGNLAYLDNPSGFTADAQCGLYIADTRNNVIRFLNGTTNLISTFAGDSNYLSKDGLLAQASFRGPQDIASGPNGELFVADTESNAIRTLQGGVVATWLTGLKNPTGLAVDGTTLYVADSGKHRIVRASIPGGSPVVVTNIASPNKLVVLGDYLYVTSANKTKLSRVNKTTGEITELKTDLDFAEGLEPYNGKIYFVAGPKGMWNEVWTYDPATGAIARLVNVVETEWYNHASDILFCNGKMYLLFVAGSSVYALNLEAQNPVKIAGKHRYHDEDGPPATALTGRPKSIVVSKDGSKVYILENHRVKEFDVATKTLTFLAGSPMDNFLDEVGDKARLSGATQMVISSDGTKLYLADRNNNRIRVLAIADRRLSTVAGAGNINQFPETSNGYAEGAACPLEQGAGVADCAYFNRPMGIAISKSGRFLYIADTDNNRIRSFDFSTGRTKLLAGGGTAGFRDGVGAAARFKRPASLVLSRDGNRLFIVDLGNHAVRQLKLNTKKVTTLVGSGRAGYREGAFRSARLSFPDSLALGRGDTLLLSEVGSERIRELNLKTKTMRLVAGSGQRGSQNGLGKKATFHNPRGLTLFNSRFALVADQVNDLIRAINLR